MSEARITNVSGWVLAVALGLVCLVLVTESWSQGQDPVGQPIPYAGGYGTSDSNSDMIAVTGLDVTGASLLFIIDTKGRQLAVYQATGGSSSTQNVKFIGGRNIDLDLQVDGYNDKSEYSYKELSDQFAKVGRVENPDEE